MYIRYLTYGSLSRVCVRAVGLTVASKCGSFFCMCGYYATRCIHPLFLPITGCDEHLSSSVRASTIPSKNFVSYYSCNTTVL